MTFNSRVRPAGSSAVALAMTLGCAVAGLWANAAAAQNIGASARVQNNVTGIVAGASSKLAQGSPVFSREVVKTDADASAMLTFLDETNLQVGGASAVTLDKYVYNPDKSAAAAAISLAKGAFRFTTGNSDPRNFTLTTPVAVIGIRGTDFEVINTANTTRVLLFSGIVRVCSRIHPGVCQTLTVPGTFVVVDRRGVVTRPAVAPPGFTRFGEAPPTRQPMEPMRFAGDSGFWQGGFVGAHILGSWSGVQTREDNAATNARNNTFNDSGNGFGGGVNAGFNWRPMGSAFVFGVLADANFLNDNVRRSFPGSGGLFIDSTITFTGNALARAGVLVLPDVLVFGETGVALANQNLRINVGAAPTNGNMLTTGFTLGGGVELAMPGMMLPGLGATSLFVDYRHTWWSLATLNTPAFNYGWARQTDTVQTGFRVKFTTN